MTQALPCTSLYEIDFSLWLEDTAEKVRSGKFNQIDRDALAEEIEALGRSEKRELSSRLEVLFAHLLKRCYVNQPENHQGWQSTIDEQRSQLFHLLKTSPSLKNYFMESIDDSWHYALKITRRDYPASVFPDTWQFSREIDALLDRVFW